MNIEELYNIAHELPKSLEFHNKYTWLICNGIIEARYLDINDVISSDIPISSYIKAKGIVLLFPNKVGDMIVDIYIRALDSKETPLKIGLDLIPFGLGNLGKDFKYGSKLILVEGISDLGALKVINPNFDIVAIQSNSLSSTAARLLSTITNNFIILSDNDSAGIKGANISKRRLEQFDCNVNIINQYGELKDSGDILELLMTYLKNKDEDTKHKLYLIQEYYNIQINNH